MKITFTKCQRINEARDGLDLLFYFVDDNQNIHKIHTVAKLGAQISWYLTQQEVYEYSKKVFPLVVNFIGDWWNKHRTLPPEGQPYFEGKELGYVRSNKLDWENYTIELDTV